MDRVDLPKLYDTGEFSDCTFVSSGGEEFPAHRFLFSQYPRLKALIAHERRVQLPESTEVVERMLRWLYGVEWVPENVQPTRMGVGKELMDVMGLCDAAGKYEIPKLADDAYATVGRVLSQISTPEVGMRVLRDITDKQSTAGALQRTIIDRMLALLPKDAPTGNGGKKRKRKSITDRLQQSAPDEDHWPQVVIVPKRSERAKTPTAKAKVPPPKARKRSSPIKPQQSSAFEPKLHCVCRKPEDPFLVQCEGCERWFHPGCIGKGKYSAGTYKGNRKFALQGDEKRYRLENLAFSCLDCDELA